ncbi:hypothetical protein TNCV_1149381 [Trichonephila clavipes]|nr:hypothetical protein TNCV_1149381 [Trichonephila clavipes]
MEGLVPVKSEDPHVGVIGKFGELSREDDRFGGVDEVLEYGTEGTQIESFLPTGGCALSLPRHKVFPLVRKFGEGVPASSSVRMLNIESVVLLQSVM